MSNLSTIAWTTTQARTRTKLYPLAAVAGLFVLSTLVGFGRIANAAQPVINISVHPSKVLGVIHKAVLGVNSNSRFDGASQFAEMSPILSEIGVAGSRWPGGLYGDVFNWREAAPHTMTPFCSGWVPAREHIVHLDGTFDTYMKTLVIPNGLSPEIIVNYGTSGWPTCSGAGDPSLAAAWVTYANVTNHYGIKWWEVGNEQYERGEPDAHPNPHTPESYAAFEPAFYEAMKAADPTINVGAIITAGSHGSPTWDSYVLSHAAYDYVIYHYYPEFYPNISDNALLAKPIVGSFAVSKIIGNIRTELVRAGKCVSPCKDVPISFSEWNSVSHNPTPQTLSIVQALFVAETLGEYFNAGLSRAEYWADGGGCEQNTPGERGWRPGPQPSVYGWQNGIGSTGMMILKGAGAKCPPRGTILPAGRAFQVYARSGFAVEGSSAVLVDSASTSVRSYASYNAAQRKYVVIVINLDQTDNALIKLSIDGVTSGREYQTLQYSKDIYDQTRDGGPWNPPASTVSGSWTFPMAAIVPPWSITAYTFSV